MRTGFYFDERCMWHSAGEHVLFLPVGKFLQPPSSAGYAESPETKRRLRNLVEVSGLGEHLDWRSAPPATREDLFDQKDQGSVSVSVSYAVHLFGK